MICANCYKEEYTAAKTELSVTIPLQDLEIDKRIVGKLQ